MSRKCMFVGACLVDPKFPSNVYADICTVIPGEETIIKYTQASCSGGSGCSGPADTRGGA